MSCYIILYIEYSSSPIYLISYPIPVVNPKKNGKIWWIAPALGAQPAWEVDPVEESAWRHAPRGLQQWLSGNFNLERLHRLRSLNVWKIKGKYGENLDKMQGFEGKIICKARKSSNIVHQALKCCFLWREEDRNIGNQTWKSPFCIEIYIYIIIKWVQDADFPLPCLVAGG